MWLGKNKKRPRVSRVSVFAEKHRYYSVNDIDRKTHTVSPSPLRPSSRSVTIVCDFSLFTIGFRNRVLGMRPYGFIASVCDILESAVLTSHVFCQQNVFTSGKSRTNRSRVYRVVGNATTIGLYKRKRINKIQTMCSRHYANKTVYLLFTSCTSLGVRY